MTNYKITWESPDRGVTGEIRNIPATELSAALDSAWSLSDDGEIFLELERGDENEYTS